MRHSYRELRNKSIETEVRCDACSGAGFPTIKQPAQPGRKIYPAACEKCGGKGRLSRQQRNCATKPPA